MPPLCEAPVEVGDRMPARVYGPLTVMDTVRGQAFRKIGRLCITTAIG